MYKLFFQTKKEFCYIAPERFYTKEQGNPEGRLEPSMDIFSLGCVLAEVLLGGEVLFTHPQLLSFRRGELSPEATLAKLGPDLAHAQQLIKEMTQLDPSRRENIDYYCTAWEDRVFPACFGKLYTFMKELVTSPECQATDQRLAWVRCRLESIRSQVLEKTPSCALLIVDLLCSMLRNTSKASSRIEVIEHLKCLISKLSDEERMHRLLPYLMSVLTDMEERSSVKIVSLNTVVELLGSVTSLTSRDTSIFDDHIWPSLTQLVRDPNEYVRASLAKHLAVLSEIAMNFIEFSRRLLTEHEQPKTSFDEEVLDLKKEFYSVFRSFASVEEKASVQEQLMKNLPQLCKFFDRKYTTNNVLPMLFPFLSKGRDSKILILKRIPELVIIVGSTAFENFIYPCIEGLFKDTDEGVLQYSIKVLAKSFSVPAPVLLRLAVPCLNCLVHPNQLVRKQMVELLKNIIQHLEPADNYCSLRPLLLPYLTIPSQSVYLITEEMLDLHVVKSVRRQVFEMALQKLPLPPLLPHEEAIKDSFLRLAENLSRPSEPELARKRTNRPTEPEGTADRKRPSTKSDLRQSSVSFPGDFCPTGKLLCCLNEHKSAVTSLAVSPNNVSFASASKDGAVKIWRLENIETFRSLNAVSNIQSGQKKVRKIIFYEDSTHLAVAVEDAQPRIAFYEVNPR
jgi:phosphoinositide-3-kinase regulatory subunit 4